MTPLRRYLLLALAVVAVLVVGVIVALRVVEQPPIGAANPGLVTGRVTLEGRSRFNGVYVTLDRGDGGFDETSADGAFVIRNIPLGWHILRMDMPKYLAVEGRFLASEEVTVLGDLKMLAGDAYGDNIIDILDLALVSRAFGSEPPSDPRADINDNGMVDILDLVLVSKNYDRQGPTDGQNTRIAILPPTLSSVVRDRPVEAKRAADANDPTATWTLSPSKPTYAVGEVVTAALTLDKAAGVYGADIRQAYNEKQLKPRDAEPGTPQVEARVGSLFSQGFSPLNRVEKGEVRLAVSQVSDGARPASGTLLEVTFEVAGCGETVFDSARVLRLTDGKASVIPYNVGKAATLRTPCP
ncbi:MAG: hypothetical protein KIT87_11015 [Anaerolineae bacterium]|nr:hypothetical protein [Anaerolineae bacterium]